MRDARRLALLGDLIARDPRPIEAWFSADGMHRAAMLLDSARRKRATIADEQPELVAHFDPAIMALATPEFVTAYEARGSWRFFSPAYRRDRKRLRELVTGTEKLGFDDEVAALRRARWVAEATKWFDQNGTALSDAFGEGFTGPHSDWDALGTSLDVTKQIADLLDGNVSESVRTVLHGSGAPARSLAGLGARVERAADDAMAALGQLVVLAPGSPVVGAAGIDVAEFDEVGRWAADALSKLRGVWSAADEATAHALDPDATTASQLVADLSEIGSIADMRRDLAAQRDRLQDEFGTLFDGLSTDWDRVIAALGWCEELLDRFDGDKPTDAFVERVTSPGVVEAEEELIAASEIAASAIEQGIATVESLFWKGTKRIRGRTLDRVPLPDLAWWAQERADRLDELDDWLEYRAVEEELRLAGLVPFCDAVKRTQISVDQWEPSYLKRFYTLWLDGVRETDPSLGRVRGDRLDVLVRTFRALDQQQLAVASRRIHQSQANRRPSDHYGDSDGLGERKILKAELVKKRRHKPLRRLFREIPNLIQAYKPCLMMSPLSVSHFLPADVYYFDVVIFDEASQVRPQDGVGAIMRDANHRRRRPQATPADAVLRVLGGRRRRRRGERPGRLREHPRHVRCEQHEAVHASVALPEPARTPHRALEPLLLRRQVDHVSFR